MNLLVIQMYSSGLSIDEIFESIGQYLDVEEIRDILMDACLIE